MRGGAGKGVGAARLVGVRAKNEWGAPSLSVSSPLSPVRLLAIARLQVASLMRASQSANGRARGGGQEGEEEGRHWEE